MSRFDAFVLFAATLLIASAPTSTPAAVIVAQHLGDADPLTEGYSGGPNVNQGAPFLAAGPATGPSWEVIDQSDPDNKGSLRYDYVLTSEQQARAYANGWTLRAVVQSPVEDPADYGAAIEFRADLPSVDHRWIINPGLENNQPVLNLQALGVSIPLVNVNPGEFYTAELVFDLTSETAELFVNGFSLIAGLPPSLRTQNDLSPEVIWGSIGSADAGQAWYQQVELQIESSVAVLEVNRDSGAVVLRNNTDGFLDATGYSITSAIGALDSSSWTTVSPGNGWSTTSEVGSHAELSESAGDFGSSLALAALQGIDLGDVWQPFPTEDLAADILLSDGSTRRVDIEYSGNGGVPLIYGDLNRDGVIDAGDVVEVIKPNFNTDTSSLATAIDRYWSGDLNDDGTVSLADFFILNNAYLTENPEAASLSLSVPEPGTACLLVVGAMIAPFVRRQRTWRSAAGARQWSSIRTLGCAACAIIASTLTSEIRATTIRNLTTGELLFSANYESNSTVSVLPYPDTSAAFDPDATRTGSWGAVAGNIEQTQVTNFATPGANEGDNYLRIGRFTGNPFPSATAVPTAVQTTVGDVIRYETAQFVSGVTGTNIFSRTALLADGAGASIANIELGADGKIYNRTGGSPTRVDSGLTYTPEAWQTFAVEWAIGSPMYTIELNGATSIPLNVWATGNNSTFGSVIVGGGNPNSSAGGTLLYYDAVTRPLLSVDPNSGMVTLTNATKHSLDIDGYQIVSAAGSLNPVGWSSLDEQDYEGQGQNSGWLELGVAGDLLAEAFLGGATTLASGQSINLGLAYDSSLDARDLLFQFHLAGDPVDSLLRGDIEYSVSGPMPDLNMDGKVDIFDVAIVSNNWANSGTPGTVTGDANKDGVVDIFDVALISNNWNPGGVQAVPEPSCLLLAALGLPWLWRRVRH